MAVRSHHVVPTFLALVLLSALPLQIPSASADHGSVGVSPSLLDFTDPPLFPGGQKAGLLRFQQHFGEPITVDVDVVPRASVASDATDWLALSRSGRVVLPPGEHSFPLQVDVPATASEGVYETSVRFRVHPAEKPTFEGSGATAYTAVTSIIRIAVENDQQVKSITVESIKPVQPAEEGGPLVFHLEMRNTGNVDAAPHVRLDILDQMQENVVGTHWFNDTLIGPGVAREVPFTAEHGLPVGQYWAIVEVHLDSVRIHRSGQTSFDVLEAGALLRELSLTTIQIDGNLTRVSAGATVKLEPVVVNTGQAPAVGQFVGEVRRDGELIGAIESRELELGIGGTARMPVLYETLEPGQYEFVGRIHYGHKVTEEKSLLLVVEQASGAQGLLVPGVIALLVCGVGFGTYRFMGRRDD